MKLTQKALEFLQKYIVGDGDDGPEYRSGPKLVQLFNEFGFDDSYGQGFPSRWMYVRDRLAELNGTPRIKRLIEDVFNPEAFIDKESELVEYIARFNKYLHFCDLELKLANKKVIVVSVDGVSIEPEQVAIISDEFVHEQLQKIGDKLQNGDFDGSITSSRSLVEAVLGAIYSDFHGEEMPKSGDLQKDYKMVRDCLGLNPDDQDEPIKQLLNALSSIINGIDTISNRMGDRHRRKYKPQRRHAKLVVNSTKTLVDFLIDTYLVKSTNAS